MKHATKPYGVTLLEIMLVLAIASMVVVMSMKYYQSASLREKISSVTAAVSAIVAAGKSDWGAKGSLTAAATDIPAYMPNGTLPTSPFNGAALTISGATTNSYVITVPGISSAQCTLLSAALSQNNKLTVACPAGTVTVTES